MNIVPMPFVRPIAACIVAVTLAAHPVAAADIIVPGKANPWLAGMPDGTAAIAGDVAPTHSPIMAAAVVPGLCLVFKVAGQVSHGGGAGGPPPDGGGNYPHQAENGMAETVAPIDSLVGVFLGKGTPDPGTVPPARSFATPEERGFARLAPRRQEVFFIGDGLAASGETQRFVVPDGAARLFLGTMDGYGWYNNSGAFRVEIDAAPEGPGCAPVVVPKPRWGLALLLLAGSTRARRPRGDHIRRTRGARTGSGSAWP